MTRLLRAFFGGTATADPTYRFTGHEWDEDTEQLYAGARYSDPRLALWLRADPEIDGSAGGGANGGVYAYVNHTKHSAQTPFRNRRLSPGGSPAPSAPRGRSRGLAAGLRTS